jgi:hypothetical protein
MRLQDTIWSKSSSNTINAGFTFEERMERMAGRVVSDLQFVRFVGGQKLTLVFRSLYPCLYLCPLVYDLQGLTSPDSCRPTDSHLRSATLQDLPK